ncbi:unnamed protein product [Closterium sp. NIES-64]|nr:unnamed protein product [Closterium sp. NIES-65]CAI5992341.1 unnamed protein product [Closterium sp. NIES-64]
MGSAFHHRKRPDKRTRFPSTAPLLFVALLSLSLAFRPAAAAPSYAAMKAEVKKLAAAMQKVPSHKQSGIKLANAANKYNIPSKYNVAVFANCTVLLPGDVAMKAAVSRFSILRPDPIYGTSKFACIRGIYKFKQLQSLPRVLMPTAQGIPVRKTTAKNDKVVAFNLRGGTPITKVTVTVAHIYTGPYFTVVGTDKLLLLPSMAKEDAEEDD